VFAFVGGLVLAGQAKADTLFSDITDTALDKPFIHKGASLDIFAKLTNSPANLTWIGGVVIADFNGDGWNDIFVANGKGGANALYINNGDGVPTFTESAESAEVAFPDDEAASAVAGDINNDGLIDLYIANVGIGAGPPHIPPVPEVEAVEGLNRLMLNKGFNKNGKWRGFELSTAPSAGAKPYTRSQQPSLVDYDRDGDLDIYVAAHTHVVTPNAASDAVQCTPPQSPPSADCYPFKRPDSGTSILLKNLLKESGTLSFTDVTGLLRSAVDHLGSPATGRDGRPIFSSRNNFDAVWMDYDNDGDPDLVQANDLGAIGLFRNENDGASFTYLTAESIRDVNGDARSLNGAFMSMTTGDIDNDGNFDFYATNVGRGTAAPTFQDPNPIPGGRPAGISEYVLHMNSGNPNFFLDDVAPDLAKEGGFPEASLANPRIGDDTSGDFGWGAVMFDYDNDGDLDLLSLGNWFAAGFGLPDGKITITDQETFDDFVALDVNGFNPGGHTNPGHLFQNRLVETGTFDLVDLSADNYNNVGLSNPYDTRGVAVGDLNNDGFQDVVVVNVSGTATTGGVVLPQPPPSPPDTSFFFKKVGEYVGPLKIFKNNGNGNKSLILRLTGTQSNKSGIGARIKIKIQGKGDQIREVWSNESHLAANTLEVEVGLGNATKVNAITIDWPSGVKQQIKGPDINSQRTVLDVVEP
jgi:hypothetical protein